MVGKSKPKRQNRNKGKFCTLCGTGMPARDGHEACLVCLGVDHAVLAANAAGDCTTCAGLPKEVKAARLQKAREAYNVADQQDAEEPQEVEEEPLQEEDPVPAKTRATGRRASPRHSPARQEEYEEEYEGEWEQASRREDDGSSHYSANGDSEEEYDGDAEEEDHLYGAYSPALAAKVRAAVQYEKRCREQEAAQAADPAPEPAAARPKRRELPPLTCDESPEVDVFKHAAECCGVAWPVVPSSSAVRKTSIFRAFGGDAEPRREKLLIPVVPDFTDVLKASWKNPAKDKLVTPLLQRFETDGAEEAGLKSIPPMDRHVAAHLLNKKVPLGKEPTFDRSREQNVSKIVKAAYASAASSAEATNALAMLQYSTFCLLHDMKEKPTPEQILMLRRLHREQTAYTVHVAAATGKAMAQLIQVERARWLNLRDIGDDGDPVNQEVKPGSLLSLSVPEMVVKYEEDKKIREALKVLVPTRPPKASFSRKPTFGSSRASRSWSRDRSGALRPTSSAAPRFGPPAGQQPESSGKRAEKRRFQHTDPSPAVRGRGRGRGARGASAGRSAK